MNCTGCGKANRAGARFCAGCGASLTPRCPACGSECDGDAQFCDACGASLAARPARATEAAVARKVVTIVFADLIGSTALHERLDAESARRLMDRYYRALHVAVEAHGGTVVKLLGDGVMAAFGVPRVAEDDAVRAVRAAVAMQNAFRELAGTQAGVMGDVGLRVAVNTGEVVVSDDHTDVVGDPVNVAARLQQEAHDGDVLVGESTRRLVGELVTLAPLGVFSLKGRSETVAAYRVVSLDRPAGAAAAAFVGRDDELRRLMVVYDATVAERRARLAVVLGSPGLGKSRLLDEFARRLGDGVAVLTAHCDAAGGATFAPVAEAVRALLGIDEGAAPDTVRAAIDTVVRGDDAERARIAGGITALLAGSPAAPEETFFIVRRLLAALAAVQPLVLVIDDLQWAEPLLLDLTEHLVQWSTDVPLLVLAAARPELRDARSSLAAPGGLVADVVTLGGLDAAAATRLAANVIGAAALPAAVAGRVLATSEGNPLFVGELVRMLVHDGALKQEGDRWTVGVELAALEMPPTIHAVLAARIERLRPEERTVLERAAVVGRHFSRAAVAHLLPRETTDLDVRLESLRRSELIEPDVGWFLGEPVLRFHHVLIRDAAYRRLLKGTRAELHGRVADWIETKVGASVEHDETMGWHLEQAHQHLRELGPIDAQGRAFGDRAARYLAAAGRRALGRDDLPLAASLLGRALEQLDHSDPARADLALDWCEALLAVGDVSPATRAIDELGRFLGDSDRLRAWHTCFAGQLAVLTDPEALRATSDAVAAAAEALAEAGDAAGEAKAHQVHATALARLGKVGACEAALDRALAAARRAHDRRRANAVLAGAPLAALWGPSPVTRASGRCLDVVRVLRITQGAPAVEAVALRCQGVLEALRGRTEAARRMIASSRRMVEELGITQRLLEADVFTGLIELLEGDAVAAERCLRVAYDGLRDHGLGIDAAQAAALLGRALLAQGRAEEAEALSHESEALAGDDLKAAIAWRGVRAEALARRGEHASAVELARSAVDIAAATDALLDHADARLALAVALRAAGRSSDADAEEARAIELWEAKGATLLAERAHRAAGHVAQTDRDSNAPATSTSPAARRIAANAATANAARMDAAVAARDIDAFFAVLAEGAESVHHPTGAVYKEREARRAFEFLLSAEDLTFGHDPLATLGKSLALCRGNISFGAVNLEGIEHFGATNTDSVVLIEVDARGQRVRTEFFALDRLGDAVPRLYERYADLLPDGLERTRAAATARAMAALLGPLDLERYAMAIAPAVEFVDRRTVSFPSGHGVEDLLRSIRTLFEIADNPTVRVDDVLALRSDALLVHWTTSGTDRTSHGPFEWQFLRLCIFGADGLLIRAEQFDSDHEAEALARFDELTTQPAGRLRAKVRANAATASADRLDAAIAARDTEALPALLADRVEVVHHPTGVVYDRSGALNAWHRLLAATDLRFSHKPLATLGDALALFRTAVSFSMLPDDDVGQVGAASWDEAILIEVDARGQRTRVEFFAADRLGNAVTRLYERYADLLPNGPEKLRAAATARSVAVLLEPPDLDRLRKVFAPDIEFVDHRTGGLPSGRGVDAMMRTFEVLLDLATDIRVGVPDILCLQRDALLILFETSAIDRTSGGAVGRDFLLLRVFDSDGRVARNEWFDPGRDGEALARFDELTAQPAARLRAQVRANAATANAARLDAAIGARDADALPALLADRVEVVHYPTGTVYDRNGALDAWYALLGAQDVTFAHEPLATLGDALALFRTAVSFSASGQVGPTSWDEVILIEVDARGQRTRAELFAADRLAEAVTRLYERYADLPADGPEKLRAAATAGAVSALLGHPSIGSYSQAFADDVEWVDHRTLGFGSGRGAERGLHLFRLLFESSTDIVTAVDDILGLRPDALLMRWRVSGVDRAGGGAYERAFLLLLIFGSDGLVSRSEQWDPDREDEALAGFDKLVLSGTGRTLSDSVEDLPAESPARFANAASRAVERFERCWRVRDWDGVVATFAPTHVMDDRRAMMRLRLEGQAYFTSLRGVFDAMPSSLWAFVLLATRGERLALLRAEIAGAARGSGPLVRELFWVVEVDAASRRVALVAFDLTAPDAAYAELDARYAAGQGAPYAELLAKWQAFRQAANARDWESVRRVLPDDFTMLSHRRLANTGTRLSRDEFIASLSWGDDRGVRSKVRRDHLPRIGARGLIEVVTLHGTVDGGDFEQQFIIVIEYDGRQPHASEAFDLDQLDKALARYEAVAAGPVATARQVFADAFTTPPPAGRDPLQIPPNAATRAVDRWQRAFEAGDLGALETLWDAAMIFEDRRRAALTVGDREMLMASTSLLNAWGTRVARTLLATSGDRLALEYIGWTGRDDVPAYEIDVLCLTEVDADGRILARILFDPDDRRAASAEMFERYVGGDAGRWMPPKGVEFRRALAAHDLSRMRAVLPDDFFFHDHRRTGAGRIEGADEYLAWLGTLFEQSPDAIIESLYYVATEPHGFLAIGHIVGTNISGGEFESVFVQLALNRGDRPIAAELFEIEDLDVAQARLDELRPDSLRIPPNAARRANERSFEFIATRDWPAYRALTSSDFTFDDRRKRSLVSGDIELFIRNLQVVASWQVSRRTVESIATVGDRIALDCIAFAGDHDGSTFEGEFLRLTEVDADGQLRAVIHFDLDDRRAASAEAQARFVNGEAAGCHAQALIQAFGGAIARHDWDGLRKYFVDGLVYCDRRQLSFGEIPCDKFIESLHVLSDLGPDVGGEMLRVLAWNNYGRVAVIRQFGTTRDGGSFESLFVPVLLVRGDHIVAYEVFDVGDADQAVGRFAELCASLRGTSE